MNRVEHLLIRLAEECGEVVQRVSKAMVFGLDNIQEGQSLNNEERLKGEVVDIFALLEMLKAEGVDVIPSTFFANEEEESCVIEDRCAINVKKRRVEKYLTLSRKKGKLK